MRSVLDYTDIIYDNCYNIDATKVENIQRRACVVLAGVLRVTKHKPVLKEAGVEPFKTRRNYTDKQEMCASQNTPVYINYQTV